MRKNSEHYATKVPEVTLGFWIIKILATTLGETAGDTVTMTWLKADVMVNSGYLFGSAIFLSALDRARRHPNRNQEISSVPLLGCDRGLDDRRDGHGRLCNSIFGYRLHRGITAPVRLLSWPCSPCGTGRMDQFQCRPSTRQKSKPSIGLRLRSPRLWAPHSAIGSADTGDLGYGGGAIVFAGGLAVTAALYYWTDVSRVLLFWAAFILTRPLGATLGDFLDKPLDHGGLALSRPLASAVIAAVMVGCILIFPQRAGRHPQGAN